MKRINESLKFLLLLPIIAFMTSCGNDNPETLLKNACKEAKKGCPQQIDEITVLKDMSYENHCFTYFFELEPHELSELIMTSSDEELQNIFSAQFKENARQNSDVKEFVKLLLDDNATLYSQYTIKDGSGRTRRVLINYWED